jgi:hypothetical protein
MIADFIAPEWSTGAMKHCSHEYYASDPMNKKRQYLNEKRYYVSE